MSLQLTLHTECHIHTYKLHMWFKLTQSKHKFQKICLESYLMSLCFVYVPLYVGILLIPYL